MDLKSEGKVVGTELIPTQAINSPFEEMSQRSSNFQYASNSRLNIPQKQMPSPKYQNKRKAHERSSSFSSDSSLKSPNQSSQIRELRCRNSPNFVRIQIENVHGSKDPSKTKPTEAQMFRSGTFAQPNNKTGPSTDPDENQIAETHEERRKSRKLLALQTQQYMPSPKQIFRKESPKLKVNSDSKAFFREPVSMNAISDQSSSEESSFKSQFESTCKKKAPPQAEDRRMSYKSAGMIIMRGLTVKQNQQKFIKSNNRRRRSVFVSQKGSDGEQSAKKRHGALRQLQAVMSVSKVENRNKLRVLSKENQELIKQHKLDMMRGQNAILQALQMKKDYESGNDRTNLQDIDEQEYMMIFKQEVQEEYGYKIVKEKTKEEDRWIISYYNRTQIKFDFLTCMLVLFDCWFVPFKNSFRYFNPNEHSITRRITLFIDWLITLIFGVDILLGFRKSFIHERSGQEVKDAVEIRNRYLQFYFWIDLLSVVPLGSIFENELLEFVSMIKIMRLFRLEKIITFMKFSTQQRAYFHIIQQISLMVLSIHLVACCYFRLCQFNRSQSESQEFNYSFWIPQVDLAEEALTFYESTTPDQYLSLLYYSTLVLIGNDITPQNESEIMFCCIILILGSFTVSTVLGGITAEMAKAAEKQKEMQKNIEFMNFSMEVHAFLPTALQQKIIQFLYFKDEINLTQEMLDFFFDFLNENQKFAVHKHIFDDQLSKSRVFMQCEQVEVIYAASLMVSNLAVVEERIISQGSHGNTMYFITKGCVEVRLLEAAEEVFSDSINSIFMIKRLLKKKKNMARGKSVVLEKMQKQLQRSPMVQLRHETQDLRQKQLSRTNTNTALLPYKRQLFRKNTSQYEVSDNSDAEVEEMAKEFNAFQQKVIQQNPIPCKGIDYDLPQKKQVEKIIDVLFQNDMFGEIVIFSNLKRTCSIVAKENSTLLELSKESVQKIESKFPNVFFKMKEIMSSYFDEDMTQRFQFILNIPFLRGINSDTIMSIVYLMQELNFEVGDIILRQFQPTRDIYIILEGTIQVRTQYFDMVEQRRVDYFLQNIGRGACIGVYTAFQQRSKSLVSYTVCSPILKIAKINIDELKALAKKNIELGDRLETIIERVRKNLVGDIDFFPFPKKYLENSLLNKSDQKLQEERSAFMQKKKVMKQLILDWVKCFKRGLVKFPVAVRVLHNLRMDIREIEYDEGYLEKLQLSSVGQQFNVRQIHQDMRKTEYKDYIMELRMLLYEDSNKSVIELNTPTTVRTNMVSEQSIRCLSFHSRSNSVDHTCQTKNSIKNLQSEKQTKSEQGSFSSSADEYSVKDTRQEGIQQIKSEIRKCRNLIIQQKNAKQIMRNLVNNDEHFSVFVDVYLTEILRYVMSKPNCDLLQEIISRENSPTQKYQLMIRITNSNIKRLFSNYDHHDFLKILRLVKLGYINAVPERSLKEKSIKKEEFTALNNLASTSDGQNYKSFGSGGCGTLKTPNTKKETGNGGTLQEFPSQSKKLGSIQKPGLRTPGVMKEVNKPSPITSTNTLEKIDESQSVSFEISGESKTEVNSKVSEDGESSESVDIEQQHKYSNWVYSPDNIQKFRLLFQKRRENKKRWSQLSSFWSVLEDQQRQIDDLRLKLGNPSRKIGGFLRN